MLTIGDKFPDFQLTAVKGGSAGLSGPGKTFFEVTKDYSSESSFCQISLDTDPLKWKLIFFWPKDFTFVCPTEVIDYDKYYAEFGSRNTMVYGVSTDSEFAHLSWRMFNKELQNISIPLLSDAKRELSTALGIIDKQMGVALRASFILDPSNIIRWVSVHDTSVGRNPKEALRVLDALLTGELCESSWEKGDPPLFPQELFDDAIGLLDKSIGLLQSHALEYEERKFKKKS